MVALLGARQVGKTTLARLIAERRRGKVTVFDLEDPVDLDRLEDPGLRLRPLRGLVVIDEIQRRPELFPLLRVLADRPRTPARFLVLGSASPELLRQTSESLAGRICYCDLPGLSLEEVGADKMQRLWLRGGFPRSFLARSHEGSSAWRQSFISTFLERDIPQLGSRIPARTLGRSWSMLAHWHGQIWNAAEFSRSFGVSNPTVSSYIDLLASTFVVQRLQPWHENLRKRQVKSPKVYIADSGMLHSLLGIHTRAELDRHPKIGASWEGFLLNQVAQRLRIPQRDCYFWGTHGGAELDLLVVRGHTRLGFEFKHTELPKITKSMRMAIEDLGLTRLDVIHAGTDTYDLSSKIRAVAASRIWEDLPRLR